MILKLYRNKNGYTLKVCSGPGNKVIAQMVGLTYKEVKKYEKHFKKEYNILVPPIRMYKVKE
jgi:hypothetical protein